MPASPVGPQRADDRACGDTSYGKRMKSWQPRYCMAWMWKHRHGMCWETSHWSKQKGNQIEFLKNILLLKLGRN